MTPQLGSIGIWSAHLRSRDKAKARDVAAGLEGFGFGTVWIPGSGLRACWSDTPSTLEASSRIVVASGVLNIAVDAAFETGAWVNALSPAAVNRVMPGLGVSHRQRVTRRRTPAVSPPPRSRSPERTTPVTRRIPRICYARDAPIRSTWRAGHITSVTSQEPTVPASRYPPHTVIPSPYHYSASSHCGTVTPGSTCSKRTRTGVPDASSGVPSR